MLSSDLPIAKLEEDELNRGSFAESLAKTLVYVPIVSHDWFIWRVGKR